MGFTLRAALDLLPGAAEVVVSEVFEAVISWNRRELAHLAGAPLDDPRVTVVERDVAELVADRSASFHAVLLDIDNGPEAFTLARNRWIYGPEGLGAIHACLHPGGVLSVWSADPAASFLRALRRAGFEAHTVTVSARAGASRPRHTIFVARRPRRPRRRRRQK
jgi:spermidine synthase